MQSDTDFYKALTECPAQWITQLAFMKLESSKMPYPYILLKRCSIDFNFSYINCGKYQGTWKKIVTFCNREYHSFTHSSEPTPRILYYINDRNTFKSFYSIFASIKTVLLNQKLNLSIGCLFFSAILRLECMSLNFKARRGKYQLLKLFKLR